MTKSRIHDLIDRLNEDFALLAQCIDDACDDDEETRDALKDALEELYCVAHDMETILEPGV